MHAKCINTQLQCGCSLTDWSRTLSVLVIDRAGGYGEDEIRQRRAGLQLQSCSLLAASPARGPACDSCASGFGCGDVQGHQHGAWHSGRPEVQPGGRSGQHAEGAAERGGVLPRDGLFPERAQEHRHCHAHCGEFRRRGVHCRLHHPPLGLVRPGIRAAPPSSSTGSRRTRSPASSTS
jgi:hypothetical protein